MIKRTRWQCGFTLAELGIVTAVIAIMATVVLMSRGFVASSRVASAAQLVNTLRDASRSYALRANMGANFANISIVNLGGLNLVQTPVKDPWGNETPADARGPTVAPGAGNNTVLIRVCAGAPEQAQDLRTLVAGMGTTSVNAANCVTVDTR